MITNLDMVLLGFIGNLKDKGWKVIQPRVSKRIKLLGLQAKASKKYKVTTNSDHDKKVAGNLLDQDFDAQDINQKWVTDITYIPTQEGWLYLCVIIDLFSRVVIGWSMDKRMKAEIVCNTLNMALFRRDFPTGVIIHSDRGTQYCSEKFQNLISDNWLLSSMSSKGCCYDNAACESFFGTLKVELVHDEYSGEFFRTVFSQKIDVKLSKILSILTLPKYTSAGVL
ncbi:IS3 family transposase [Francisella halioticida]|uniref:IS3 family transposase n=1 Tax=Francisella halioticida TaxID=549298 RepID=UPI001BB42877